MVAITKAHDITWSEIERYKNQGRGKNVRSKIRLFCPIHGGDNQRSLVVYPERNYRYKCFNCGSWGTVKDSLNNIRGKWNDKILRLSSEKITQIKEIIWTPSDILKFQQSLPNSNGARYLNSRGITTETAERFGLGFAEKNWPGRTWKWSRVVFPHTNPEGKIINLYGRTITKESPKGLAHDHLKGPKGLFNAKALLKSSVFICEGPMDALTLLQMGLNACACFGVNSLRQHLDWIKAHTIIIAFDNDEAGKKWNEVKALLLIRGKRLLYLDSHAFGKAKDINEAYQKGSLILSGQMTPQDHFENLYEADYWPKDKLEKLLDPLIQSNQEIELTNAGYNYWKKVNYLMKYEDYNKKNL